MFLTLQNSCVPEKCCVNLTFHTGSYFPIQYIITSQLLNLQLWLNVHVHIYLFNSSTSPNSFIKQLSIKKCKYSIP